MTTKRRNRTKPEPETLQDRFLDLQSFDRRVGVLEEQVRKLELLDAERQLLVLDVAEKVSTKLQDRGRKRENGPVEPSTRPWEVWKRGIQPR